MKRAWVILCALTLARTAMGFQFQSVAAVGPPLADGMGISFAALGTLMGLYLLPGAFVSLPGGWLGRRFGDKRVVLAGLAMMTGGGALLVLTDIYHAMLAGRLISGIGAVLLNVLLTKMVADWFVGRRIVIAMSVLISSWPLGIAIALLSLGPLSEFLGLKIAFALPVATCAVALFLIAFLYGPPADASAIPEGGPAHLSLSPRELSGALLAGTVWCFYNVAFILPLSFGSGFLTAKGMELAVAGAITSLASWLVIPALPLGGWLAERIGRPDATMTACFLAIAGLVWSIPFLPVPAVWFAMLGLLFGPAGGLIMSLPAQVLRPENRAVGMGIFFTVYYVGMGICPAIAGLLRDVIGDPAAPLYFAGLAILVAQAALVGFRRLAAQASAPATI